MSRTTDMPPDAYASRATARPPRRGLLVALGFASIGAGMAQLTPAILTLSVQARTLDPVGATGIVSLAHSVGAVLALIAFPAFGRLSDRSLSKFGRRRPLLVLAAALFGGGAVAILADSSVLVLVVGWVLTTVGYTAGMVAILAVIAEALDTRRRGAASVLVGLSLPLGAVIGLFIAQLGSRNLTLQLLVPAAVGIAGVLALSAVIRDAPLQAHQRPAASWRVVIGTFWINPVRHPDFGWAWFSRFLVFLGVATLNTYQVFYLIEVLHVPDDEIAGTIFHTTLVLTCSAVVCALVVARISDRIGRRKPFVLAAALIFGAGLTLAANAHDYGAFLVAIAVTGAGQGVYFAVDIALVTEILPSSAEPAHALGVINLASNLPSSIVPAIAPAVLLVGATATAPHNFAALFLSGGVAGLVGAAAILAVRRAR